MKSVIISVKLKGKDQEYDLEVPANVPAEKLAELITHNLDPYASTRGALTVRSLKPGSVRMLPPTMTLAEAGLWDGVFLEIGPADSIADSTWADILMGWVPLDLDTPADRKPPRPVPPKTTLAKPTPDRRHISPPLPEPGPAVSWMGGNTPILSAEEMAALGLTADSGATNAAADGDHETPL